MIKNHLIKFLVTEYQFNKIKLNAQARGFLTISQYLRHLALDKDLRFEKMLSEVHKKVVKKQIVNKKQEINSQEKLNVEEFGFSNPIEFVLYHWGKLPESSRNKLQSVGIHPKSINSESMPQEEQNINKNELSYNNQEIKPEIPEWIKMLNKLLKENNNP